MRIFEKVPIYYSADTCLLHEEPSPVPIAQMSLLRGKWMRKLQRVLNGLEQCTMLRSLFIQENIFVKMEALDNLRELRQLNLNDNMVHFVEGLEHCERLETLYLKRNRLGNSPEQGAKESNEDILDSNLIIRLFHVDGRFLVSILLVDKLDLTIFRAIVDPA